MRIAILDNSTEKWTASGSFTRMLALSLRAVAGVDIELGFLTKGNIPAGFDLPRWAFVAPSHFPGEVTLRQLSGKPRKTELAASVVAHRIDVVLPLMNLREPISGAATIGWIPDFQYRRCPQFFPEAERLHHESVVANLTTNATHILLSSKDALADLIATVPGAAHRATAIPFPSLFAFESPTGTADPCATYRLPKKFMLVANQFWAHKNHGILVHTAALLRERGCDATFVCTGLPLDHRSASNAPLSELLQAIAKAGVSDTVRILGQVPFPDLVGLLRQASVIVQPSRSEGWSTTVQDALALGRPVICSDLPVHREQAPNALGFFSADDPAALATIIAENWSHLTPSDETVALATHRESARNHGEQLLALCRAAAKSR